MFQMNFSSGTPQEEVSVTAEANDILTNVMPYGVSLLLHVGLLLVIAFVTVSMAIEDATNEKTIVPFAGVSPIPGTLDPLPVSLITPPNPLSTRTSPSMQRITTNRSLTDTFSESAGTGSGSGQNSGGPGAGNGTGKNGPSTSIFGSSGSEGSQGGTGTLFQSSRGESSLPSNLFGVGGNGARIVYLIDSSGTLIQTLPFVVAELKRSIGGLTEKQSFAVIFFQGGDPKTAGFKGMRTATRENKTMVFNWIDSGQIIAQGGNNPVKAVQLALSYQPDLIYILSDNITGNGVYQVDQRTFVDDVVKANKPANGKAPAKINTIQFITPDPLVNYGMKPTLKEISDRTGGLYKYLDAKELGIE